MFSQKKFIVSHAPFWHDGSSISERSYHIMLAALPAVIWSIYLYGTPVIGVVALSVSTAMLWEAAFNYIIKRSLSIGDGNAAVIGLIFAMLLPATTPWWIVAMGTLTAVIVGKQIFGGIGANPFNPVLIGYAVIMLSWGHYLDFDEALRNYDLNFAMAYPLSMLKNFGISSVGNYQLIDLLMGKQAGGIGAVCGAALIAGGLYLIARGFIRWEISLSFIAGVCITALLFNASDPAKYAGPLFHLLTGFTLIGAFFLATEDASSPVNFIPMIIYGAGAGMMTVLIRNIGAYADGAVFAILLMNLLTPLLDKIRPKALGKAV